MLFATATTLGQILLLCKLHWIITYCTGKNWHVLIITVSYRHVELGLKNEEHVAGRDMLLMALAAMVQLLCLSLVPHMPLTQPVPLVPCVYALDQTQNLITFK